MSKRIGLVGLGSMGLAMAERLHAEQLQVFGFDTSERARVGAARFCVPISVAAELANQVDTVLLSLPSSTEVEQVLSGPSGLMNAFRKPALFIDTSTCDPRSTVRLAAEAAALGHCLVDAPVSGGPVGARAGTLSIALAGSASGKTAAREALSHIAQRIIDVGGPGAGHMTKLANNFLVATNLVVLSDLCKLIASLGYEAQPAVGMINGASGRSGVTDVNYPKWIATQSFDSGFTVRLMDKDVRLGFALAEGMQMATPVLRAISTRWNDEHERLGGAADFNRVAG